MAQHDKYPAGDGGGEPDPARSEQDGSYDSPVMESEAFDTDDFARVLAVDTLLSPFGRFDSDRLDLLGVRMWFGLERPASRPRHLVLEIWRQPAEAEQPPSRLHRPDGPAVVIRSECSYRQLAELYYENGSPRISNSRPWAIFYRPDGKQVRERWWRTKAGVDIVECYNDQGKLRRWLREAEVAPEIVDEGSFAVTHPRMRTDITYKGDVVDGKTESYFDDHGQLHRNLPDKDLPAVIVSDGRDVVRHRDWYAHGRPFRDSGYVYRDEPTSETYDAQSRLRITELERSGIEDPEDYDDLDTNIDYWLDYSCERLYRNHEGEIWARELDSCREGDEDPEFSDFKELIFRRERTEYDGDFGDPKRRAILESPTPLPSRGYDEDYDVSQDPNLVELQDFR